MSLEEWDHKLVDMFQIGRLVWALDDDEGRNGGALLDQVLRQVLKLEGDDRRSPRAPVHDVDAISADAHQHSVQARIIKD